MALFKKPKKNIRARNIENDEEETENGESAPNVAGEKESSGLGIKPSKKRDKEKDVHRSKQTILLSFGDEEEEGEVFQIKKSLHSKKLIRQMDKERKKKRGNQDKADFDEIKLESTNEVKTTDDIVVVLKNSEEEKLRLASGKKKEQPIILNGRAALAAGKDDLSSSDDDEGSTRHKFSQPNHVKIMIESGKIPDAATIHAARKKRQQARELGAEYIPVETSQKYNSRSSKSRLIGEDQDGSDEEENRIDMSVHVETKDVDQKLENYYNEEEAPEDDEWENQQIRKGVTSASMVTSQSSAIDKPERNQSLFTNVIAPQNKDLPSPQSVVDKVRERLNSLKDIHNKHLEDKMRAEGDLKDCVKEAVHLESEAPGLAEKFRFYQEMRGYVTDLVECLDEKMPGLLKLEEKAHELWSERAEYFAERRRQDVRDQADEMSPFARNPSGGSRWSKEEEEAKSRRAAEREGRRTRRRRLRELKSISVSHVDGMSSDDELTESELTAFKLKIDEIYQLGEGLLDDVVDDFGTIEGIATRLESWKKFDVTTYTEAYASLCLPKLMGPLVRLQLLTWNPILGDYMELESTPWWGRLLLYDLKEVETCESITNDPDVLLVPLVIERVIIPKITQLIKSSWDPISSSQTLRIVGFLGKYVTDTPTLGPKSRHMEALLQAIIERLKSAVDNDVFIPINLKISGETRGNSSVFFQRQFACAVKLLRNILSFQGFIGSEHLQEIALDSLLNRYLMAALRTCTPCDAIYKANMIMSTFPRWWFQSIAKIKRLEMFSRHLKHLSTQVHEYDTTEKESYELVNRLLCTLEVTCPEA